MYSVAHSTGDDHKITGLKIEKKDSDLAKGLFGCVNSGTIKNLTLESPSVTGGDYVGAVVGFLSYGTIENCHVATSGTISGEKQTGGIVGWSFGGKISDCSVESTNIEFTGDGGGIVGNLNTAYEYIGSVTGCRFTGTLKQGEDGVGIGGIVGYAEGIGSIIKACYANCTLEVREDNSYAMQSRAGGVVGLMYGSVTACYAIITKKIEGTPETSGGVVGFQAILDDYGNYVDSKVNTCYWSGTDITYGIGGKGNHHNNVAEEATNDNAVQVSDNNWSAAMSAMNAALSGTDWLYVENTDAETKDDLPLVIASLEGN